MQQFPFSGKTEHMGQFLKSQSACESQGRKKRLFKNLRKSDFSDKKLHICHLFEILQLAPVDPVLLLSLAGNKLYESI